MWICITKNCIPESLESLCCCRKLNCKGPCESRRCQGLSSCLAQILRNCHSKAWDRHPHLPNRKYYPKHGPQCCNFRVMPSIFTSLDFAIGECRSRDMYIVRSWICCLQADISLYISI